jgi:peptidoglycan/LPS O-acetylase OafA/YrhL
LLSLALAWVTSLRAGRARTAIEVGVLVALICASTAYRVLSNADPRTLPFNTFAATFAWFALGMLLALASVEWRGSEHRLSRLIARHHWACWLLAAAAYVVLCRGLGLPSGRFLQEPLTSWQVVGIYLLSGIVAVGLALPAVFGAPVQGGIARVLGFRPVAWLGLISYGIFLYQQPLLHDIYRGSAPDHRFVDLLWLLGAGGAATIAAGAISYYVVERPALRLKETRLSAVAAKLFPARG